MHPRKPPPLPLTSREVQLNSRPVGLLSPSDNFTIQTASVPTRIPPYHALVRVLFVSADPAMRGWMSTAPSYIPPVRLGDRMRAAGVGEVVRVGEHSRLEIGEVVGGMFGWGEYSLERDSSVERGVVPESMGVSHAVGVLGGTGMTAWFGLFEVGRPQKGEVVVVSAAAGATGSVVSQLAKKVSGCYVIGIAGGSKKCRFLTDVLGLDAAVDYKAEEGVGKGMLAALGKRRIDVYFDSVGGETLEVALRNIAFRGRVVMCGAIGSYNNDGMKDSGRIAGPRNIMQLVVRRARMEGFIVFDYRKRYAEARRKLGEMVADGTLIVKEDVWEGLENAPEALLSLFEGRNVGKVVVKVGESVFQNKQHGGPGRDETPGVRRMGKL